MMVSLSWGQSLGLAKLTVVTKDKSEWRNRYDVGSRVVGSGGRIKIGQVGIVNGGAEFILAKLTVATKLT